MTQPNARTVAAPAAWKLYGALATVYVVWGSTYMAIRIAVGGMPPFLMAGLRYAFASVLMLLAASLGRRVRPSRREVGWASLVGLFLLVGGNGLVVWAETTIPSGLAALLVAALPLWTLVLTSLVPSEPRPTAVGLAGIALGLLGVGALVWPSLASGAGGSLWAELGVLLGSLLWAIGSLIARYRPVPADGFYNAGFNMAAATLGFGALALATGEWGRVSWALVPASAWWALAYLVVMGSCVAFTAFAWLLQNGRPGLVATYTYVNPAVAIALGACWMNEPLTPWTLAGAGLVVLSIVLVIQGGRPASRRAPT